MSNQGKGKETEGRFRVEYSHLRSSNEIHDGGEGQGRGAEGKGEGMLRQKGEDAGRREGEEDERKRKTLVRAS